MPLYTYECTKCKHVFEDIVAMSRRDKGPRCEECQGKTRRLITGGSFMLIGGGWSGTAHPVIIPPQSDPNAFKGWHDNYSNCKKEDVQHLLSDNDPS